MKARTRFGSFVMGAAVLAATLGGCAGVPRAPEILATVSETFPAPYDSVWDATLKNLGVLRLLVADKAAGRIETEVFPFAFTVGDAPARPKGPALLAALEPRGVLLAQDASGDNKPTQVVWIAMRITVSRVADSRTQVQVEPHLHHSLLTGFTPGPTSSPWADLFAKIRSSLGVR